MGLSGVGGCFVAASSCHSLVYALAEDNVIIIHTSLCSLRAIHVPYYITLRFVDDLRSVACMAVRIYKLWRKK